MYQRPLKAMQDQRVRQRCWAAVRNLDVPDPFDLAELIVRLEHQRSRKIQLVAVPAMPDGLCGLYIPMGSADYIFHEEGSSPLHREHIIMHELGHAIMDHQGGGVPIETVAPLLFPTLNPDLVRRVLGRTAYSAQEEKEAETLATLVLRRARRPIHHDPQVVGKEEVIGPFLGLLATIQVVIGTTIGTWGPGLKERLTRWRSYCRLRPLWRALRIAFPEIVLDQALHDSEERLYRRIIEIRDGQRLLRPYRDPAVADAAASAAQAAGMDQNQTAAQVEAAILAAGLRTKHSGRPAPETPLMGSAPPVPLDLNAEVALLEQVAVAFSRSSLVRQALAAAEDTSPTTYGRRRGLLAATEI